MSPIDGCIVLFSSAVVLFQSREHPNCGPQPGFVRAHIESNEPALMNSIHHLHVC
jgi:hypothetical protein